MKTKLINPLIAKVLNASMKGMFGIKAKLEDVKILRELSNKSLSEVFNVIDKSTKDMSSEITNILNNYLKRCPIFVPNPDANYKKISDRASKFLTSLGLPDRKLKDEYSKFLGDNESITSDFIEISGLYIYAIYYYNYMIVITHDLDGNNVGTFSLNHISIDNYYKRLSEREINQSEFDVRTFDPFSLLINLWVSEKRTNILINTTEPTESIKRAKLDCEELNAIPKPFGYRYIHITDENWKKYESALTAVKRADANYKLPSWLVRAHFRNYNGKCVLIKAHYAYRRCGEVQETELINLYV